MTRLLERVHTHTASPPMLSHGFSGRRIALVGTPIAQVDTPSDRSGHDPSSPPRPTGAGNDATSMTHRFRDHPVCCKPFVPSSLWEMVDAVRVRH